MFGSLAEPEERIRIASRHPLAADGQHAQAYLRRGDAPLRGFAVISGGLSEILLDSQPGFVEDAHAEQFAASAAFRRRLQHLDGLAVPLRCFFFVRGSASAGGQHFSHVDAGEPIATVGSLAEPLHGLSVIPGDAAPGFVRQTYVVQCARVAPRGAASRPAHRLIIVSRYAEPENIEMTYARLPRSVALLGGFAVELHGLRVVEIYAVAVFVEICETRLRGGVTLIRRLPVPARSFLEVRGAFRDLFTREAARVLRLRVGRLGSGSFGSLCRRGARRFGFCGSCRLGLWFGSLLAKSGNYGRAGSRGAEPLFALTGNVESDATGVDDQNQPRIRHARGRQSDYVSLRQRPGTLDRRLGPGQRCRHPHR